MTLQMQFPLADLLRRHGITQKRLAEAADMRPATLNALVKGKTGRVEIGTLLAVVAGLRKLGIQANVGDLLRVEDVPDDAEQAARERALRLLGGEPWGLKPRGSAVLAEVSGPPIEELLREHRGPDP